MKVRLHVTGIGMTLDDITDDIHKKASAFFGAEAPYSVESVEVYPEKTMTGSISHNFYEAEVLQNVQQ